MPAYTPWTTRTIGIEMEVVETRRNDPTTTRQTLSSLVSDCNGALRNVVNAHSVRSMGYAHSNGQTWDVKTDASCGFEVASPALRLNEHGDNAELKAICDALSRTAKVTTACGLHVHVDVADFSLVQFKRLLVLWARYEPFFFSMLPSSRRGNHYCGTVRSTSWTANNGRSWNADNFARAMRATTIDGVQRNLGAWASDRYHSMNLTPYWMSGRVEFRLHSGTVDYDKIRTWASWLLALVERAKDETLPVKLQTPKPLVAGTVRARRGGISTGHVLTALLLPVDQSPVHARLASWANARRAQFDENAQRRTVRGAAGAALEANEAR